MITLLLILMSMVCVLVPWNLALRFGTIKFFSPLHLLSYMAIFGILVKTIYMQIFNGEMYFHRFGATNFEIVEGFLYITIFVLMICVGYVLALRRVWRVETINMTHFAVAQIERVYTLAFTSVIVAIIVVSHMLLVRGIEDITSILSLSTIDTLNSSKILAIEGVEGFGASFTAIRIFLFLPNLALVIFLARYIIWRRSMDFWSAIFFIGLEFLITVLEGSRFGLVFILMNGAIISILLGVRFTISLSIKSMLAIMLVFFLFVMMTTFRASQSDTKYLRFDAWKAIEQIIGSTYFLDINMPILIIKLSDSHERFWGESYTYWIFAWIPRQVWPEKPAITLGPYVKQEILGFYGSFGGVNPTGPGEAFLNFGWFGIFVGFFIGVIFRMLEVYTLSEKGILKRGGLWIYPIVVAPLIIGTMQSSFSAIFISTLVLYVMIRITLLVLSRSVPVRRRAAAPVSMPAEKAIDAPRQ